MLCAGVAWGIYSLRGKGVGDPTKMTAENFLFAVPLSLALSILTINNLSIDTSGFWYAVLSGTLTSGIGYTIWYLVLPTLKATNAAVVQLSVPVIAALGGIVFLGEPLTLRLALATVAILGGITLVVMEKRYAYEG
jgi:drug/metabolite transporter (DMT)-like permease